MATDWVVLQSFWPEPCAFILFALMQKVRKKSRQARTLRAPDSYRDCRAHASLCAAVLTHFWAGGILLWVMIDKRRLAAVRSAAGELVGGL
jgi:hypothetical protein